jgi:hypothetical protein
VSRPALLQWITLHELEALRNALARGDLPPDFLGKLKRMTNGDLSHHLHEGQCRSRGLIPTLKYGFWPPRTTGRD